MREVFLLGTAWVLFLSGARSLPAAVDISKLPPAASRTVGFQPNMPDKIVTGKDPSQHWAFKAPVRPKLPSVSDKKWVRTPVDRFVLARLDKEKLKPSPEAEKVILL